MNSANQADSRPQWPRATGHLVGLAAAVACTACSGDLSPPDVLLETRIAIEDSRRHELKFEAPPDAAVIVTISGRGVDVRGMAHGLADPVAGYADAPNRRMGVETLLIEAGHPATVAVAIERNDHAGAHGHVDVRAATLPLTTESDRRRLDASRLEAQACLDFPDIERGAASGEAFVRAARFHAETGQRRQEGLARLQAAGVRYTRLADWAGAADLAAEAEPLLARADAPEFAAYALRLEGAALDQRANASGVREADRTRDLARARERLTEASERFKALGNNYEAGYALNYRGVSYDVAGDRLSARRDFLAALDLFRKAVDPSAQALSLQSLATQSYQEGRLSDSMREFDEALALIPGVGDPENYAHTLNNSAWPLRAVGRFDEATARFHEAGEILHRLGDRDGQARALHGLATTLMQTGEPDRAEELLKAAVQLRGETGARREQAISLLALGELQRRAGKLEEAIGNDRQALELVDAPHDVAQAKLILSRAYRAGGQLNLARQELEGALRLPLPVTHLYRGLALGELGIVESLAGSRNRSSAYFEQALTALRASGSDVEHARTLVQRAESRLRARDSAGARTDAMLAVAEFESIGSRSLQAESRAAFRASYRDALEVQIVALLENAGANRGEGNHARANELTSAAFAVSDRGHAQFLFESAQARGEKLSSDAMARRRQLFEILAAKRQQRERLQATARPDEERISELTREIARLRSDVAQLELVSENGRSTSDTREARPDSLGYDIQSLTPSVVAEYFIGRDHAWLFVLKDGHIAAHRLGTTLELTKLARDLHLAWRQNEFSSADRTNAAGRIAAVLFRNVPAPPGDGSLFVIPDGVLHVVPMALIAKQALPALRPGSVQVVTALGALLDRPQPKSIRATRLLAVVADPIYTLEDARLLDATASRQIALLEPGLTRYADNHASIRRLPATMVEARAISALAGTSGRPLELIGPDATRRNVMDSGLSRFRIIHFAAHAFADSQDPGLAKIVLSRFDGNGEPIDGNLHAFDIAELGLNADLVVLSACNTAIGREIAGEAPLGLSHAFLQGGAQSVLATLWQVPDSSTALLMEAFYRELLINKESPAAALELAQQSIRKLPRWSDPYFWAGFQLVSNARFSGVNNNVERRGG
jgi:tetratricopeptide (TPR) repeat protein